MLFAGDEKAPGKMYSFKVFGVMRHGRPEYYAAEAKEEKGSKTQER
jgi:hypothetical protein